MKSFMAPIGFASFLENDNASRTKRDTRWRNVLWKRSMWLVLRAHVLIARCCAAGLTPAYPTY